MKSIIKWIAIITGCLSMILSIWSVKRLGEFKGYMEKDRDYYEAKIDRLEALLAKK